VTYIAFKRFCYKVKTKLESLSQTQVSIHANIKSYFETLSSSGTSVAFYGSQTHVTIRWTKFPSLSVGPQALVIVTISQMLPEN